MHFSVSLKMKLLFLVLCTVAVLVESHDSSLVLSVSNSESTSDSPYPLVVSCKGLLSAVPLFWTGPNGKHITYSSDTKVHASILAKEVRLQINDLEEKDHGTYICHGLDGLGSKIEISFVLPNEGPPVFEKDSVEVHAEEAQNVTLICQAEGDPTPENKWLDKMGVEITSSSHPISKFKISKTSLEIYNVEIEDSGFYTCRAENSLGSSSLIFILNVTKPSGMPVFKEDFVMVEIELGQKAFLFCEAQGDPKPQNKWYDNFGSEIKQPTHPVSKFEISTNSLTIHNVTIEDSGKYICLAENAAGSASKTFFLKVTDPSENRSDIFVTNITVLNVTEDSVTFSLSFDETVNFTVRARYWTARNSNITYVTWAKGDKYSVQNLDSGVKYFFQFSAMRSQDAENWSETISVTLPPGAPEIVFRKIGDRSLTIEWFRNYECIELFNGTLDHYRINYRTVEIKGGNQWEYRNNCEVSVIIPNCFGSQYRISGLMEDVYYEIKVQTHNSAGYGKPTTFKIRM